MDRSFAYLWNDAELSDFDVLLGLDGATEADCLAKVPAHRVLLSLSPMLRAQILRWNKSTKPSSTTPPADQDGGKGSKRADKKPAADQDGGKGSASKPQIVLILKGPEQQTAGLIVLKPMYAVNPLSELLAVLSQVQQLQAAVLADEWEVPDVSTAVVDSLKSCATNATLSDEAVHELLRMPAHPDCLQPLVKSVLMSKFGDLEAAWADATLREMLLKLSLPLMEQLLSYDDIKVHSEETVLYTAQEYVDQLHQRDQPAAARKLAPLIRCPHLSAFWLSLSCMSMNASKLLLFSQRTHVQKLLMLRLADQKQPAKQEELQQLLKGAPESWWLKQRAHKKTKSVEMTWELDMKQLKAAAIRSATENRTVTLDTDIITPPFRSTAWTMYLSCYQGKYIGLYMKLNTWVQDFYYRTSFTFTVPCINKSVNYTSPMSNSNSNSWGTQGLFKDMAGGWDEAVWKAAGLPTTGKLALKLSVTGVGFS